MLETDPPYSAEKTPRGRFCFFKLSFIDSKTNHRSQRFIDVCNDTTFGISSVVVCKKVVFLRKWSPRGVHTAPYTRNSNLWEVITCINIPTGVRDLSCTCVHSISTLSLTNASDIVLFPGTCSRSLRAISDSSHATS